MSQVKTVRPGRSLDAFINSLEKRKSGVDPKIEKAVSAIVSSVKRHGDRALVSLTKRFDGHGRIRLLPREIKSLARRADPEVVSALKLSMGRIRAFHERQMERSWSFTDKGSRLGQIIRPLRRAGIYIPGGKASYPSSVLMNVIPAQVAGVPEIALVVPTPKGEANPCVMAAIEMLGVKEVYSIGGAQAIAALAYGTETIPRVDKIVGPGNIFVATAKRMVFGEVDIDMIAGPSEILVIADRSADPAFVAADLLGQAEHDELASSVLVTDSPELADGVARELKLMLAGLPRKEIARKSLNRFGAFIVVKTLDKACEVADRIAPEHLEVMTKNPSALLPMLHNAGAIFLGKWTPEPLGDYSAGPNHTLPTSGTARFSSPLGVYDFIKRTSLLEFGETAFRALAPTVLSIAQAEGLSAHARAVSIRTDSARADSVRTASAQAGRKPRSKTR